MTSSYSRLTVVLIGIILTIRCSTMHTRIIFLEHFLLLSVNIPSFFLYLFTCFYSWAVFCVLCFAISLSRNVAFEKRLCMERGPGLPTWSLPKALLCLCDLFNFFLVWSVLISAGNGETRTGALEKGLLSVHWAFPTSDTL